MTSNKAILTTAIFLLTALYSVCTSQVTFIEHAISEDFDFERARSVYVIDLDDDDDYDILGAAPVEEEIRWWENDGNEEFTEHVIREDLPGANCVWADDLDGDDDIDVLGTASHADFGDYYIWWENNGDEEFEEHIIESNIDGSNTIKTVDLDDDGDLDIIGSAGGVADRVVWFENDGNENFTLHVIATGFDAANSVYAADINDDGDIDIIDAAAHGNRIYWWESDGSPANGGWIQRTVINYTRAPRDIHLIDIDDDDDMDLVSASSSDNDFIWWENNGNGGFTRHDLNNNYTNAYTVYADDLDGDNDVDVIGGGYSQDRISWWENDGEEDFTEHLITDDFDGPIDLFTIDLDQDNDMDFLCAGYDENTIAWFEQVSPSQFDLAEPVDDSVIVDQPLTLRWHASVAPDSGDPITYFVNISTEEDFAADTLFDADTDTFLIFNMIEDNSEYWWQVYAYDEETETVKWSNQTWTFEINLPPEEFDLTSPDSGSINIGAEITLSWQTSNDPGGAEVVYDIYLSDNPDDMGDPVYADIEDNTYTFEIDEENLYYWTVLVLDDNTPGTFANSTWSFYADLPDLPSDFELLEPENGEIIPFADPYEIETAWQQSVDPDLHENVIYSLNFMVTLDDESERTVNFDHLRDTVLTINIPEELELYSWSDTLSVNWWVRAVSGDDEVECLERFTFYFEPGTGINTEQSKELPTEFKIEAVYPNPFNPELSLIIALPEQSGLKVQIYNILGKQVALMADENLLPGYHKFTLNAENLTSGIYFIHATVPGKMDEIRKVVLVR